FVSRSPQAAAANAQNATVRITAFIVRIPPELAARKIGAEGGARYRRFREPGLAPRAPGPGRWPEGLPLRNCGVLTTSSGGAAGYGRRPAPQKERARSEEHTSGLQSPVHVV